MIGNCFAFVKVNKGVSYGFGTSPEVSVKVAPDARPSAVSPERSGDACCHA
jgi:hypothetical protein